MLLFISSSLSGVEESQHFEFRAWLAPVVLLSLCLPALPTTGQVPTEVRHTFRRWTIICALYSLCFGKYRQCFLSCLCALIRIFSCCAHVTACCRFVSDYGPEGYNCVCQHRLLQALLRLNIGPEYTRTYPPCLLEWTANRKRAHTVLHIHCFDGEKTHLPFSKAPPSVPNLFRKQFML